MAHNVATNSRFASVFATLICAWVVALVVLGLSTGPRPAASVDTPAVAAAR